MQVKPTCPDCKHSYMQGEKLMCGKFNVMATPRTSHGCTDFEREPGADGVESEAHKVWYCDSIGRGD